MIIECPECGAKNQVIQPLQPGKEHRCGKCGAVITFLQTVDTEVKEDGIVKIVDTQMGKDGFLKTKVKIGALSSKNTSGQGSLAVVPREIAGWNWGAFWLNWIWSIGNNVWIGLLCLIPFAGIIMVFILGVKGNEWAWQNKRWDSVEHFKKIQGKWQDWGLGLVVAAIIIGLVVYSTTRAY
jgi:hypothetical protein